MGRLTPPHVDADLHVPIELAQDRDHAIEREALQPGIANTREIGGCESCKLVRAPHADPAIVEHANNSRAKNGLRLKNVRVGMAEIAEDVPAAAYQFEIVFAHCNASFSRFSRSLIRFTSTSGVLIPLLDFF